MPITNFSYISVDWNFYEKLRCLKNGEKSDNPWQNGSIGLGGDVTFPGACGEVFSL